MNKEKSTQMMAGLVGLVVIMLILKFFIGSANEPSLESEKNVSEVSQAEPEKPFPTIPEINIKIAVDTIKEHSEVRDAAVSQKGSELSLTVIVGHSVTETRAKELGDDFVRMVMSNAGKDFENSPEGKQIGSSRFSYLIGVYRLDETQVALGVKAPAAKWITW